MINKFKYLLTIRKHRVKEYVTEFDLDDVYSSVLTRNPRLITKVYSYEIDPTYRQLHMHLIVHSPYKITYKNNCKFNNFRIHWSPIGDQIGASKYITKKAYNEYEQEHILIMNYYNNHYGFT